MSEFDVDNLAKKYDKECHIFYEDMTLAELADECYESLMLMALKDDYTGIYDLLNGFDLLNRRLCTLAKNERLAKFTQDQL